MGYAGDTGDPYLDPDTGVLKNLAGIGDATLLNEYEGEMSVMRQIEISAGPSPVDFNFSHLKALHRHLFQDVYSWAGKPRTVDISKGTSRFGSHLHIDNYLTKLFARLASDRKTWKQDTGQADWACHFADLMGEINAVHPFREGNGRTQRLFTGQLAGEYGFEIRWDLMTSESMLAASVASFNGDNGPLGHLIARHLVRKD